MHRSCNSKHGTSDTKHESCNSKHINPGTVQTNPNSKHINPGTVQTNLNSKHINPGIVQTNLNSKHINPGTVQTNLNSKHETSLSQICLASFNKVSKITTSDEDGSNAKELDFVYGPDYGRRKTVYSLNSLPVTTRYYAFGNYEETVDASNVSTKDYFIYGGDGVAAIYRITGTTTPGTMYYIHKDNLGSFDKVTNSSGAVVDSYSFDAWGNRRSTTDWTASETTTTTNNHLFSRGFTGHEHLDAFGLINMNGRCYDPLLGRILSPDPELQDPSNIQNYNRYSYCLNNPLKYTDPSGYSFFGNIGAFFSSFSFSWGSGSIGSGNVDDGSLNKYIGGILHYGNFMNGTGQTSTELFPSPEEEEICNNGGSGGGGGDDNSNTNVNTDCTDAKDKIGGFTKEEFQNMTGINPDYFPGMPDYLSQINDFLENNLNLRIYSLSLSARFCDGLGIEYSTGVVWDNDGNASGSKNIGLILGYEQSVSINISIGNKDLNINNLNGAGWDFNLGFKQMKNIGFGLSGRMIRDAEDGTHYELNSVNFSYNLFGKGGASIGISNTSVFNGLGGYFPFWGWNGF